MLPKELSGAKLIRGVENRPSVGREILDETAKRLGRRPQDAVGAFAYFTGLTIAIEAAQVSGVPAERLRETYSSVASEKAFTRTTGRSRERIAGKDVVVVRGGVEALPMMLILYTKQDTLFAILTIDPGDHRPPPLAVEALEKLP